MIELLSPIADKPVAKIVRNFLEKKGEGVYEVAIAVNDVDAVNRYMKENGVRVGAEPAPVPPNAYTSANARLMWMSPKTLNGVFLEFIQR